MPINYIEAKIFVWFNSNESWPLIISEVHVDTDETSTLLGQLCFEEQSQKFLSSLFQEENIIVY